jgi:hypothetical protein
MVRQFPARRRAFVDMYAVYLVEGKSIMCNPIALKLTSNSVGNNEISLYLRHINITTNLGAWEA